MLDLIFIEISIRFLYYVFITLHDIFFYPDFNKVLILFSLILQHQFLQNAYEN